MGLDLGAAAVLFQTSVYSSPSKLELPLRAADEVLTAASSDIAAIGRCFVVLLKVLL